jgi:hypothetical protein
LDTLYGSYDGVEGISNHTLSYYVELELKQDRTCTLRKTFDLSKIECRGEWTVINDNLIEIKCNRNPVLSDIEKALQGGSFIEGNIEVRVLNKNKLKLDNVVLKRNK